MSNKQTLPPQLKKKKKKEKNWKNNKYREEVNKKR